MKVCFVIEHFYPQVGGVETEFYEFARNLGELGVDVRVVTSASGGVRGEAKHERFVSYHFDWPSPFGHPVPRRTDIDEHVRWADVVHTTTYTAAPVALRVAGAHKKPCLISVQEVLGKRWFSVEENPIKALGFQQFERYVVTRKYAHWHAISHATARDAAQLAIPADRIAAIHLGIDNNTWFPGVQPLDLRARFGLAPDAIVFLFFGRPGKTKGASLLLEAVGKAHPQLPPNLYFCFLLGNHPPGARDLFKANVAQDPALAERVRVLPSVPFAELPGTVKAANVVVIPSLTEGFGFSAAESCALGMPVVSSDAGSLPEVVSGKHLFFKSGDSTDLAAKLLLAAENRFDEKPRSEFSWATAAKKLLDVYSQLSPRR